MATQKVYVFKRGQRVPADHPAVRACPEAFVPLEEWVDAGQPADSLAANSKRQIDKAK